MPDHRVLELGCGPGYFSPELSRRLPSGLLVVADLQAEMLAMTRAKFEASARSSVSPIRLDARVLPFRAGAFDVVFLSAVLGETGDPVASVDEITRVVAPRGRLVVAETLGDPDRISLKLLRSRLEPRRWALTRHRTRFWSYTAEFVAQTVK